MKKVTLRIVGIVLVMVVVGGCARPTKTTIEMNKKLDNIEILLSNQPGTPIKFSMDRYLLNQRNIRLNDPNKMSYLYVIAVDGTWLNVTIVGKLASTSKRLTPPIQRHQLRDPDDPENDSMYLDVVGPAPDDMGTWGQSDAAHVGMTTLGALLEIGGFLSYFYSETPITFQNLDKKMVTMVVEATPEEKQALMGKLESLKRDAAKANNSK